MQILNVLPKGLLLRVAASLGLAGPRTWRSDGSLGDKRALVSHHPESKQGLKTPRESCPGLVLPELHLDMLWQHWAFSLSSHALQGFPQIPCHLLKLHIPQKCLAWRLVQS